MTEFTHKVSAVLEGVLTKLFDALSTVHGWVIGLFVMMANFFSGYHLVIYGILAAVVFDAFFGIWVALRQKKFIISELARATLFKLMVYLNLIVVFVFIDKFVGASGIDTKISTMLVSSAICLAEAWSSCGNALIINPNFPFLRLMRKALTGEIARKLDVNPDEVEDYLNNKK